jgi:hypothetical protein
VVLVVGAYVVGQGPERRRRLAVEGEGEILRRRLELAEARVRLCALLGEVQRVMQAVSARNYGQARALSSRFFDHALPELARTPEPAFRRALEDALGRRADVDAALAQARPKAMDPLRQVEARLKSALGQLGTDAPVVEPLAPERPARAASGP